MDSIWITGPCCSVGPNPAIVVFCCNGDMLGIEPECSIAFAVAEVRVAEMLAESREARHRRQVGS